jgi:replicative DNA helicase
VRDIVKSCFGQTDKGFSESIVYLMDENAKDIYKPLGRLINPRALALLDYMQKTYENAGAFPSENLFLHNFPDMKKDAFDGVPTLPVDDLRIRVRNYLHERIRKKSSEQMKGLIGEVADKGWTQEVDDEMAALKKLCNKSKTPKIVLNLCSRDDYIERSKKPRGMITGIEEIDELIFGMDKGTTTVIAGFTGHYKTMFAVNVAYINSYTQGYNIAYFTLETPKFVIHNQMLSRHSYHSQFNKYPFIPHDKIRKCTLTQDEMDYLYNVIQPDLYSTYIASDGKEYTRGSVTFLDSTDFGTYSFEEITNVLEALDDKLSGGLDAIIVDYAQLCKFEDGSTRLGDNDNKIINKYIAFFRNLALGFRSGSKQLSVVLLSQISRDAYTRAKKNKDTPGYYDLTCLADANELERGANRVLTVYTSENMKLVNEAQVQLLKNRNGPTRSEPEKVFALPEAYNFGVEEKDNFVMSGSNFHTSHHDMLDIDGFF